MLTNITMETVKWMFSFKRKRFCRVLFIVSLFAFATYRWNQVSDCDVICERGIPCQYPNELDFRIIIITYNRPESLEKTLQSIMSLDTLGDKVGVNIWIDKSEGDGSFDNQTLRIAQYYTWQLLSRGFATACVHIQSAHASIMGQWIDTWRPKELSSEWALILEDDIDVSRHAYRWIKSVKERYQTHSQVAGITLQMEAVMTAKSPRRKLEAPESHSIFGYRVLGTWGYVPHPVHWRNFQDWFHSIQSDKSFHPYVENIISTRWYKLFEEKHKEGGMWSQWFIYYCHEHRLFSIYPNLVAYSQNNKTLLCTNRRENGLHFARNKTVHNEKLLLEKWDSSFVTFPETLLVYGYDGEIFEPT